MFLNGGFSVPESRRQPALQHGLNVVCTPKHAACLTLVGPSNLQAHFHCNVRHLDDAGAVLVQPTEKTVFDDEEQKRREVAAQRAAEDAERLQLAYNQIKGEKNLAEGMREQELLRMQMQVSTVIIMRMLMVLL